MKTKFTFRILLFIGVFSLGVIFNLIRVKPVQASNNLAGRILLQVQDKGQAWYVNPLNNERYYLGRPIDAWNLMRQLGLGVSNNNFKYFQIHGFPVRLWGRILLQVQDKGQAWYVSPLNGQLYYLGRPSNAWNLMRSQALGINNQNLAQIPIAPSSPPQPLKKTKTLNKQGEKNKNIIATGTKSGLDSISPIPGDIIAHWMFKYQNHNYEIFQNMSTALYHDYASSTKTYVYNSINPPTNLRNDFYALFLKTKTGDNTLNNLITKLKAIALKNNWTDDQLVQFTMALVQYIPYDQAKLSVNGNRNTNPYYPYETLYLDRGVCSDKSFLAVSLLRKLGYGAAILDFPDINHSAVGIQCPIKYSINGSGYCYVETTNYFPLGVIPQDIDSGQAQPSTDNPFTNLFNPHNLGSIYIYQATKGKVYQGIIATRAKVKQLAAAQTKVNQEKQAIQIVQGQLNSQEIELNNLKNKMDSYYQSGQISEYNALVSTYNNLVAKFNLALSNYKNQIKDYNINVNNLNQNISNFYQK